MTPHSTRRTRINVSLLTIISGIICKSEHKTYYSISTSAVDLRDSYRSPTLSPWLTALQPSDNHMHREWVNRCGLDIDRIASTLWRTRWIQNSWKSSSYVLNVIEFLLLAMLQLNGAQTVIGSEHQKSSKTILRVTTMHIKSEWKQFGDAIDELKTWHFTQEFVSWLLILIKPSSQWWIQWTDECGWMCSDRSADRMDEMLNVSITGLRKTMAERDR